MADDDTALTSAQRWARDARRLVNEPTMTGFDQLLHRDFVQESRRTVAFEYTRRQVLGSVDTMRRMGLHVHGDDLAVAGQHHLLTRRRYEHRQGATQLLVVTAWTEDGLLLRMVEFDDADVHVALAELEALSGLPPVVLVDL